MNILIVEDNAFNAFCLTRLLQATYKTIQVSVVDNSLSALYFLENTIPSLIILDGELRVNDELHCNGPALADIIWSNRPQLPIIAWTNSDSMRHAFSEVFKRHQKPFNDLYCWRKGVKIMNHERILGSPIL